MGQTLELFRPPFNCSVGVEARESNQSSDAGLLLVREMVERSQLFELFDEHLHNPRDPDRVTHLLTDQVRVLIVSSPRVGMTRLISIASGLTRYCA
jgi:hypothetical protein